MPDPIDFTRKDFPFGGTVRTAACHQPKQQELLKDLKFPKLDLRAPEVVKAEALADLGLAALETKALKLPKAFQALPVEPVSPLVRNPPNSLDGAAAIRHIVEPVNPAIRVFHIQQTHTVDFELLHDRVFNLAARLSREEMEKSEPTMVLLGDGYRPEGWPSGKLVESTPQFKANVETLRIHLHTAVDESQSSIGKTLLDLKQNHNIKSVYAEMMAIESYDGVSENMKIARDHKGLLDEKLKSTAASSEQLRKHDAAGGPAFTYYDNLHSKLVDFNNLVEGYWQLGAAFRLYRDRQIEAVLPSETEDANAAAVNAMAKAENKTFVQEVREFQALRIISEAERKGDGVAVLIYGKAHSYKDNIEAWNRAHPERTIALTEVTPKVSLTVDDASKSAVDAIKAAKGGQK